MCVKLWQSISDRCTEIAGPDGNPKYLRNLKDVSDIVNVSKSNIIKAMPENIEKYHKKVSYSNTKRLVMCSYWYTFDILACVWVRLGWILMGTK